MLHGGWGRCACERGETEKELVGELARDIILSYMPVGAWFVSACENENLSWIVSVGERRYKPIAF